MDFLQMQVAWHGIARGVCIWRVTRGAQQLLLHELDDGRKYIIILEELDFIWGKLVAV